MTAKNWINHVDNIGIVCELKVMQETLCACPESLQTSPLYFFLCGVLMGRALTEDVTQIDLSKAPYEGKGAVETIWNPQYERPLKAAHGNHGS